MASSSVFCAATCSLALGLAGPALAQRAGQPVPADTLRRRLDEVVVTATRTEKSITDVPIPANASGYYSFRYVYQGSGTSFQ